MLKKQKTLSEFPVHIYSELTDTAFCSFQALINSLLKGKKERIKTGRRTICMGLLVITLLL